MPIRKPMSDAIEEYLTYRVSHGDAHNTIRNTGQVLRRALVEWGNIPVASVSPRHIAMLFHDTEWSASTRNQYRSTLLTFFKWARACGYAGKDHDPLAGWGPVRVPEKEQFRLPVEEFPALLDAAPHPRDRMICALGLFTLQRGSEIAGLRIRDVDLDSNTLRIYRKKTKKEDFLPIALELREEILRWLTYYRKDQGGLLHPDWYFVPAKSKAQWKPTGHKRMMRLWEDEHLKPEVMESKPYRAVQRALAKLGYKGKGLGVHSTRRSGARALVDANRELGVDNSLLEVGSWMGHEATRTTQLYVGLNVTREQRNEKYAGKLMFPALRDQDASDLAPVVDIRPTGSEGSGGQA